MARASSLLKRLVAYPLCGILALVVGLILVFVFGRGRLADGLYERGLEQYRHAQYEQALESFLLALKCDPDHDGAGQYKTLCYVQLAPDYDVARIVEYLTSDNGDLQRLGLELAIERNVRGLVEHIAPLARSETPDIRQSAELALRVLRSHRSLVRCTICQRDAEVTIEPGQSYPVECPLCRQVAAYPIWQCGECGHTWVVTSGTAWSCPKCGAPNVGSADLPDDD